MFSYLSLQQVILGLSYDQKIDLWSLGCILAELWTSKVLFHNESIATLLGTTKIQLFSSTHFGCSLFVVVGSENDWDLGTF
jgi:serine/threonine protein kinase